MGTVPKDPKRCTRCKQEKPRSEFYRHPVAKNGVVSKCKECSAAMTRERNALNPQRLAVTNRRSKLKRNYGITLEAYDKLLAQQDGGCAICGTPDPGGRIGAFGPVFHVDHCHESGAIRGLLCHCCNTALGSFRDDVERLSKAIAYLGRVRS